MEENKKYSCKMFIYYHENRFFIYFKENKINLKNEAWALIVGLYFQINILK